MSLSVLHVAKDMLSRQSTSSVGAARAPPRRVRTAGWQRERAGGAVFNAPDSSSWACWQERTSLLEPCRARVGCRARLL